MTNHDAPSSINTLNIKKIHIIMNPVSGPNPAPPETIKGHLEKGDLDWELTITEKESKVPELARKAAEAGADVVAAYGGDGTVMEVAEGLMGTGVPLAILPAGTANVMSVELSIPGALESAMRLAAGENAALREVDMGCVNDKYHFMLRVGIGLEAALTQYTTREEKQRLGKIAYWKSAIAAWRNSQPARYFLTIDGQTFRARGVSCIICNSANVGIPNLALAPAISVSDGRLDVLVIPDKDPGALLTVLRNIFKSRSPEARRADGIIPHWRAHEVTVRASRRQEIGLDGEAIPIPYPMTVKVLPQAIKVVVPQGSF
jgi:diacylglycerol kinase (ATP)